jgi:hypothetical protein
MQEAIYPLNLVMDLAKIADIDIEMLPPDYDIGVEYALRKLEREHPGKVEIVTMRYRDRMTLEQIAKQHKFTRENARKHIEGIMALLANPSRLDFIRYGIDAVIEDRAHVQYTRGYSDGYHTGYSDGEAARIAKTPIEERVISIDHIGFSVRTHNCLKRANLNTTADIAKCTYQKLSWIRNMGKQSIEEVINRMRDLGYDVSAMLPPNEE